MEIYSSRRYEGMRNYSSRFKLPSGRWAYIQLDDLAGIAKQHVLVIRARWTPPGHFYHLRPGGHVAALRQHQRHVWYGKIDLSRFFGNVSRNRIIRCLKSIGYSFHEAESFAIASTVCVRQTPRRFALPYGFVQSPLLASLALDKSDLGNCCRRFVSQGVTVTVYVDDIIVSADTERDVEEALAKIRRAAQESRFPINEEKSQGPVAALRAFNIQFNMEAMEIVPDRYEALSREVLANGAGQVSQGILAYVRSVSEPQAERMVAALHKAFPGEAEPAER